jgi:hypothetical protein
MDRSYKEVDLVHVHLERVQDPLIKVFSQVPYRVGGMDYYLYQDRLYYGYQQPQDGYVYILLSKPVPVHGGIYVY